jgi:hypothetical protein
MTRNYLTLETLGELDSGRAGVAIDREIARAVADLQDRGAEDKKPRKVTIELELVMDRGLVLATVQVQAKLPTLRTGATMADFMHRDGEPALVYSSMAPDNPDQATLPLETKEAR